MSSSESFDDDIADKTYDPAEEMDGYVSSIQLSSPDSSDESTYSEQEDEGQVRKPVTLKSLQPSVYSQLPGSPETSVPSPLPGSPQQSVPSQLPGSPQPSVPSQLSGSPQPSVPSQLLGSPQPSVSSQLPGLIPVTKKKKIFPVQEKTTRKRKRNPEEWKKNKRAAARAAGESYTTIKNKINCRLKCSEKFTDDDWKNFMADFYKLDINGQNSILFNCIKISTVARPRSNAKKHKGASFKYFVSKDGADVNVCKDALCALYQLGRKKTDVIKAKVASSAIAPTPDRRGRHDNRPHKMSDDVKNEIRNHILMFPSEESHYSRHENKHKRYLSPLLNISLMYKSYLEMVKEKKLDKRFEVKLCSYTKIFNTEFNLSFGHPRSDTCSTCDSGGGNDEHKESVSYAQSQLQFDRKFAKENADVTYLTVDLQQTMPLPKITTSKVFYLRQLWFYNLGVHCVELGNELPYFFNWCEHQAGLGSLEIFSCLLRFFESEGPKEHVIIWSDSCCGQNKNFTAILLYQYLIVCGLINKIDHKFPIVGHTYLDSDRVFGRIEKRLRKNDTVYSPDQYRRIITESGKWRIVDMEHNFREIDKLAHMLKVTHKKKMC